MNRLKRRNFLKLWPSIIVVGRYGFFPQPAGPSNATVEEALSLVRTLNTIEAGFGRKKGAFASKSELLGPDGLVGAIRQSKIEHPEIAWVGRVHPDSDEILDGWIIDFDSKPSGYVLVLSEKVDAEKTSATRNALTTDQVGVIYRAAVFGNKQPNARDLASAVEFPGAVPHDRFIAPAPQHRWLLQPLSK